MCLDNLCNLDCTTPLDQTSLKVHMGLLNAQSLSNKTFILCDVYDSHALDVMFLTETWLCGGEVAPLLSSWHEFLQFSQIDKERRGRGLKF